MVSAPGAAPRPTAWRPRLRAGLTECEQEVRRLTAATRHAAVGGPRGRALASTVVGAKRQATSGHGVAEISTGQNTVETAGGSSMKPGPATQKTQWVSPAGPPGSPGCSDAVLSWRQSAKPAQSVALAASAESGAPLGAPAMAADIAKAMPCTNKAQMRRHAVSRRHLCHPCAFRYMPVPESAKSIGAAPADATEFRARRSIWNAAVARRAHKNALQRRRFRAP
jgi:hypothetical protein